MPLGTVLWSIGSNATSIVPAVPSESGVADVFAMIGRNTVQAITDDGTIAWTAPTSTGWLIPDFQGGLITITDNGTLGIAKLDGKTGQPLVQYNVPGDLFSFVAHPDGTVFANVNKQTYGSDDDTMVIGIDPITAIEKFRIHLAPGTGNHVSDLMVAGDGYAYLMFWYNDHDTADWHYRLLRVNSSGAYSIINIVDWTGGPWQWPSPGLITNGDSGVVLTWTLSRGSAFPIEQHLTVVSNGVATDHRGPEVGGQVLNEPVYPTVQTQDGSFVGYAWVGDKWYPDTWVPYMVAFDQTGAIRWVVANEQPQIATGAGRVIGKSGVIYNANGGAIGLSAGAATESWKGREYVANGAISSMLLPPLFPDAASFWPQVGGNPSANGTAFVQCPCLLQTTSMNQMRAEPGTRLAQNYQYPVVSANDPLPGDPPPGPATYIVLEGDPGLTHNGGRLYHVAAETEQDRLNGLGNLVGSPIRVSSVQDFANALIANGSITGGVVYFGHGGDVPYPDGTIGSGLAPGEMPGPDTNITAFNVNLLSNAQLAIDATITLRTCRGGYGAGRYSTAQMISDRLKRKVYAFGNYAFFTRNPDSTLTSIQSPTIMNPVKPVYLIQEHGKPFTCFYVVPGGCR